MTPVLGKSPPSIVHSIPGPQSQAWVERLAESECPALTMRRARRAETSGAPQDPIVWTEARGSNVRDADGNIYVDLTSGFGVAAIGHRHPRVVEAAKGQCDRLIHALGDVSPSDVKVRLLERLKSLAPWPDAKVILGLNGADAVDAALKSAVLSTGKAGVLAFEGGYHGLGYGALSACGYSRGFRAPFLSQLNPNVCFAPWPQASQSIESVEASLLKAVNEAPFEIGAILLEPIQGRGGVRIPPAGFLTSISRLAQRLNARVIVDEIYTGLARAGSRWACDVEGFTPDLLLAGKALGGGFPVSACLGKASVMAAWGEPDKEALHTATFLGQPVGCAAALAALDVIEEEGLIDLAKTTGNHWLEEIQAALGNHAYVQEVRGRGMMLAIEFIPEFSALALVQELLRRGFITLPCGAGATALQLSPPINIEPALLPIFLETLIAAVESS